MTRVYRRLLLVAAALVAVSLVVDEVLGQVLFSRAEEGWYATALQGGYSLAEEALAGGATEAQLTERFGVPIRVEATPTAAVAEQLADGAPLGWSADLSTAWSPMADGRFLVVGPYADYPLPHPLSRLLLLAAVTGLFALGFWWTLRPLDRSQRALTSTAEAMAGGQLGARIPPEDYGAAEAMAVAFNGMADRVEALLDQQQTMLRTVSHELRTPISRLRIGVHLLAQGDEGREARAVKLDEDLEELDELVEELLLYARLEAGLGQEPAATDVRGVVEAVFERAAEQRPAVALECRGDGTVQAVPHLLRRALRNLVGNAARHGTTVAVSIEAGEAVVVHVDDDGPGMPEADRARALQPFERLGRTEADGHGMGLAIVQRIADGHGGSLQLGESPLGGLRATLRWPGSG